MPAPTLTSITISDTNIGSGEQPTVTFTFSEPVRNFGLSDIVPFGGFLDMLTQQGVNSPIWTARFNPFPNTDQDNQFIRVDLAGVNSVADDLPGVGFFDSVQRYSVDTIAPTVTQFTISDPVLRIGETATVTIKFSEAVTLPIGNLFAQQAVYSNLATADGGVTWTATLTPNANAQSNSVIGLQLNGATDLAGNTTGAAQPGPNLNLNTIRPTLTISLDDTTLKAGQTATVTFTFSESVNGFDFNDISAFGIAGSLQSPVPTGLTTFTADLIPFTNVTDTSNIFSVNMAGVTSATSGNAGTGMTQSPNFEVDTQAPTVSVGISDANLGIGQTGLVTFTFSEAVTGFTNSDVVFGNGTLSTVTSGDGGVTWTATFTPTAGSNAVGLISVDANQVTDLFGNPGTGTGAVGYGIDSVRPTLVSVTLPQSSVTTQGGMIVEFVFSEPITGFGVSDVTFPNARLSIPVSADGINWVAALQPPMTAIDDPTNVLTIDLSGIADLAGNTGTGTFTSTNYLVDTVRPDVTITLSDNALAVDETMLVTFRFNAPVTGFTAAAVIPTLGSVTAPLTSDGGLTFTSTYTPPAGLNVSGQLIQVIRTNILDLNGNRGTGSTASGPFAIDSTAPTATITISDTDVRDGETPMITITFSEPVQPFSLSTPNGVIGPYTISNGGLTYRATYTPNPSVSDATNVIAFNGTVRDIAGNALSGSPTSANYTVLTSDPPDEGPPPEPPPLPPPSQPAPPPPVLPGSGVVVLSGSVNSDVITGTAEPNRVAGGEGADTISGEAGDDTLSGDAGDDNLQGNTGLDYILGGTGNDTLHGGQDADFVQGGADNDMVFGDRGADTVHGGQGDDQVFGGDGDDVVSGDRGADTLSGGAGADIFRFGLSGGQDLVTDFNRAEGDVVRLDPGTVFTTAQVGVDTVVTLGDGSRLVLAGVQLSSLQDGWIIAG